MSASDSHQSRELSDGGRLMALNFRLRLLLTHLAGDAILARTEPDDLLQEVFLRAMTSAQGLPPRDPHDAGDSTLYRLLAQIARHVVVDVARSIRALKRDGITNSLDRSDWSRVQGLPISQIAGTSPGPLTLIEGRDEHRQWIQRFRNLAPEYRRVIGLRQFEGKSARATAARMGRSETAIHSLYRRALEAWDQTTPEK